MVVKAEKSSTSTATARLLARICNGPGAASHPQQLKRCLTRAGAAGAVYQKQHAVLRATKSCNILTMWQQGLSGVVTLVRDLCGCSLVGSVIYFNLRDRSNTMSESYTMSHVVSCVISTVAAAVGPDQRTNRAGNGVQRVHHLLPFIGPPLDFKSWNCPGVVASSDGVRAWWSGRCV